MTQFTQTSTLELNKRKIPRPRKGDFNYYAAREGALKVKGYNFGEKDVVLDRDLEEFNTVNTFGITNNTSLIEALRLLTINSATDISNLTDINGLLHEIIPTTYANLIALRNASQLEIGKRYLITDYVPCWNIFDGGTSTPIVHQTGVGEMLLVTASTLTTISKDVISVEHPSDTIYYSLDLIDDRDIGFGDGAGTPIAVFKGMVYYRKDTIQNVETHYDFRNVKFRRWAVNAVAYDNGTAYVAKDVCKASDGKIYKCITATAGEGDPSINTADWVLWLDITADAFVSWTADKTQFNVGDITTDNLIINNVTAGVDYDDFYTFGDYYNWVKNVNIGMIDLEYMINEYEFYTLLNNVIFKTQDNYFTCYSNEFNGNTINSTFLSHIEGNVVYDNYMYNIIIGVMQFNKINRQFYNNLFLSLFDNKFDSRTYGLLSTNVSSAFNNNNINCEISNINFNITTHVYGYYNCTIYQDKTDGVKLSYMDGGVMQVVDVTA